MAPGSLQHFEIGVRKIDKGGILSPDVLDCILYRRTFPGKTADFRQIYVIVRKHNYSQIILRRLCRFQRQRRSGKLFSHISRFIGRKLVENFLFVSLHQQIIHRFLPVGLIFSHRIESETFRFLFQHGNIRCFESPVKRMHHFFASVFGKMINVAIQSHTAFLRFLPQTGLILRQRIIF